MPRSQLVATLVMCDGPALEHGEVGPGKAQDLGDDLDREVEGELLDQVGVARPANPSMSSSTTRRPAHSSHRSSTLERKVGRDQGPVQPVLGLVHLQDGPAHHRAHDPS